MEYDTFISHASEDKDDVARPLADELIKLGYSVWYDEFTLKIGDSLRRSINHGLSNSRFGMVILSIPFLEKRWTNFELDGLTARENQNGQKVILPIWHKITPEQIGKYSLPLLDRLAATTDKGIISILPRIVDVLGPPSNGVKDSEILKKQQEIQRLNALQHYTVDLYNEWHSTTIRESRIFISAWTKDLYNNGLALPSLSKIENQGGNVENHIFCLIHFFEKWSLLTKNGILDKKLMNKLLGSYLVWYETNLIDPLMAVDERNQDFKNLLRLIKQEVFNIDIHTNSL